ncbi:LIM domain-containing protein WLIM1 isoform X2 [Arachis ipaensis]|uniref:LIM domain-containing protein WLIM1 isoform X2 n=1 Tax=Arachis ipaensis TaxID=130454 RepID=UPI000A2B51BB|nr:LIM domain-containing protein WLIM1 isoform X2 [Arachis ipaensis]
MYLQLSNYNSFEGVLYCRPHFDQLFKRTGSLEKSFEGTPKVAKPEKNTDEKPAAAKVSSMFGGTRDKCAGCQKTVYPTEKVTVNGTPYHKSCFKCCHGGCVISPSNYIAHEGKLYCKHHHVQLIKEKGNLSQLEGDHEKSAVQAKINGEEVTAET